MENVKGDQLYESRLAHAHGTIKNFVNRWSAGSPVAVETVGNWYWVVDEIEAGGGKPQLVNARLAKLMMGSVNKSDKLDARGMNRLQRTGTLPTVWIPSSSVRDARELPRIRMVLSRQRTQLKNRVHATLGKYGYTVEGASDAFGRKGRKIMEELSPKLPRHTQQALRLILDELDHVTDNLQGIEGQMIEVFAPCGLPPVGVCEPAFLVAHDSDLAKVELCRRWLARAFVGAAVLFRERFRASHQAALAALFDEFPVFEREWNISYETVKS